ncbi:MAG: hypothetical protein K9N51_00025 [Candidatus Pacebacteria bacterium]|nr:hypothetical protein [Candidatus Paceibacterota bacterium]
MHPMNIGNRNVQDLDGDWGLMPDPMGRAVQQRWWNSERQSGQFFPSYDEDAFWPTRVPGAFNRIHEKLAYYEGQAVYLHHFETAPVDEGEHCYLHFEGVADRCRVFLNGQYIGEHDGGFIPFTIDATPALQQTNRLLVYVDNTRQKDGVPGIRHDWWHDGGIHRPVKLVRVPAVHVREAYLTTRLDGDNVEVKMGTLIHAPGRDRSFRVNCTLVDPDSGTQVFTTQWEAVAGSWSGTCISLPRRKVRLWQTDDPHLYRLEVSADKDNWCDTVGLRELRTDGRAVMLNGTPIVLRGVCTWTEDPDRGIFSMSEATARKTLKLLQKLNCNFARAGHCPPSREFVRACDRAGILVWAEVPAYWIPTMQRPSESRRALHMLDAMVRAFRNNPSVAMWCIGNECLYNDVESGQSNLDYFLTAADLLHREDPSRLVTYASGSGTLNMTQIYPPQLVEKVDVISFNSYSGINDGADPEQEDDFQEHETKIELFSGFGKPVILSEVGIDAVKGEEGFDYGEARQAEYHTKVQALFAAFAEKGMLQGITPFVLNDFATPIKLGRFQAGYNRKGLLTETLEPKQAFDAVREGYEKLGTL